MPGPLADPTGRYGTGVVVTPGPPGPTSHVDTYPTVATAVIGYNAGGVMAHPALTAFAHPALHKK